MSRPLVNHNGAVREMNETEYAEYLMMLEDQQPEPTVEEQLIELKRQLAERDAMIIELVGAL